MKIDRNKESILLPKVSKHDMKRNRLLLVESLNDIKKIKELIGIKKSKLKILTQLNPIISELCDCLSINAYQASITFTNHLLEKALKAAIILDDGRKNVNNNNLRVDEVFKESYDRYDDMLMDQSIKKCCSIGLISKKEKSKLMEIKEIFRNPYSHANTTKILDNVTSKVTVGYLNNSNKIEEQVVNVGYVPFMQGNAQLEIAKKYGYEYFRIAIYIVALLDNELEKRYKS